MEDTIYRQEAIRAFDDAGFCTHGYIVDVLKGLPSAQPTYTDEEIQKMADLEQAEIEKAYQLGYEDGKENAQPEIIRCKECKWYELPSHKITENCVRWMKSNGILLPIKPNDYCSYAERRTDEGFD